jgi:hypothetical protein
MNPNFNRAADWLHQLKISVFNSMWPRPIEFFTDFSTAINDSSQINY